MTNLVQFFELAQLAEASYADFSDPDIEARAALIDNGDGFSPTQADLFLADWQIVSGAHRPNTDSGHSSTLFRDIHDPTRFVLAFRGTEGLISYDLWSEDIGNIATDGIAIDQIVDLYNEWQRIKGVSFE